MIWKAIKDQPVMTLAHKISDTRLSKACTIYISSYAAVGMDPILILAPKISVDDILV